jgi:hypothetical protein
VPTLVLLNRVTGVRLKLRSIAIRPLAVRPSMGSVDAPVLPSIENGSDQPNCETGVPGRPET